jgi:hypothetical protein
MKNICKLLALAALALVILKAPARAQVIGRTITASLRRTHNTPMTQAIRAFW